MKQALIIGSTVADITVSLHHLPVTGEDVLVAGQSMSLGGCAYNVSEILRQSGVPYTLFSPVGTGIYGDYVREALDIKQIPILIPRPQRDNGCCYCFVEDSGERTFAALHGAEYRFEKEWFLLPDHDQIDRAYVCGLELEEETGGIILDYLEHHPEYTIYFAPGPRITSICSPVLERMFSLSPILHLNADEALRLAGMAECADSSVHERASSPWDADILGECAAHIVRRTGNHVIITLGAQGAYLMESSGKQCSVHGYPARQADTTGAGDSHIGAVIAGSMMGYSMEESIKAANRISAAVVETPGAGLKDGEFRRLWNMLVRP